jgi:hypothetical protein
MGNNSSAKGDIGAVLILTKRDGGHNVEDAKALIVGKDGIKPNVWYTLRDGHVVERDN